MCGLVIQYFPDGHDGYGSSDVDVAQFNKRVAARLYEQGKVEYAGRYRPVTKLTG